MAKDITAKRKEDLPVELESQLILRLPPGPSCELRKVLRNGTNNLKDRLTIQLENDMRHGTVRFDNWFWPAKLVDLPCILETHKTIDRKTFYKTADISQMLLCREDDDSQTVEEEDLTKKKDKKEILKAEKKYQWPHGITPPLKNARKRRFRKTLKKKYVDAPEIEKEVKRLFRVDNEAVNVKWEVITDEDDGGKSKLLMGESVNSSIASPAISGPLFSNSQSLDIAEHDIFGEVVSSSEDEADVNIVDSGDDEASRMSIGNLDVGKAEQKVDEELITQFSKKMLQRASTSSPSTPRMKREPFYASVADHIQAAMDDAGITKKEIKGEHSDRGLMEKLDELRQQLVDVRSRRKQREREIASIENQALKQRFQSILDGLIEEEKDKQRQYEELTALLQHH